MSLNYAPQTVTAEQYEAIFQKERAHEYPAVDALEQRLGFALDRGRLESAARVLSCPMKAAAPNWQHGRVIYATARSYVTTHPMSVGEHYRCLDIGTAKGFSALCMAWALEGCLGVVTSVDVMPPTARVRRNTVAEVDSLKTLAEILAPWPEAAAIHFEESSGISWLQRHHDRIHVAFVDGKHTGEVVRVEGALLAGRQEPGDVTIFDDVQIEGVGKAVDALSDKYALEYIQVLPTRIYAIGVRR